MMTWDHAFWAAVAMSVWALYQSQPYKAVEGRLEDRAKRIGIGSARILTHWVFWTLIPVAILLSHRSLGRMRLRLPILRIDAIAMWLLLSLAEYLSVLWEFYARNTIMKDLESAKRVISWTEDITWSQAIVGGLGQNIPEETFFRGFLLGETYSLSPWLGYAFSSIAFGLSHRYWDKWKVLNTTLGGLIFAYLFVYTDSIIPPITAHIVTNVLIIPPARYWSKRLLDSVDRAPTTQPAST